MTVGERIKQRREELGLTQDDVAKRLGYKSRSSIQKIESTRDIPLKKVAELAKVLDCTPGYLMGWEDQQKSIEALMTDARILSYAIKIGALSDASKQRICDYIDYIIQKYEGGLNEEE